MEKSIDLSIVVPAYNAEAFLDRLFTSFLAMEGDASRCELIIVNDGSTDNTLNLLSQWMARGLIPLRLVTTPGLGPGQARETGAGLAKAPWVALVDADEQFSPGWLRAALAFVDQPGTAAGCEGVVEICDRHHLSLFSHQTESLKPGRYLTANLMLKRSLVRFYGRYGRRYYFREDSDLCFQLLDSGYEIAHSPQLLLYHPPLQGTWWKPIRLALRYQYDGLLARRFPQRYWHEVDAHSLGGVKIPLLRMILFLICLILQLVAFAIVLTGLLGHGSFFASLAMAGLLVMLSSALALAPAFTYISLRKVRPAQLVLALLVYGVVPWFAVMSWVYGFWVYRQERPFTAQEFS